MFLLLSDLGELFQIEAKTQILTQSLQSKIAAFRSKTAHLQKKSVAYIIWNEPLMSVGGYTFIQTILELFNFQNAFARKPERYPIIETSDLKNLDLVLLSSEPFPFKEKHIRKFEQFTQAEVVCVDGEYFSWYGSRFLKAFDYFESLLTDIN